MVVPASEAVTDGAKGRAQQVGGIRVAGDVKGKDVGEVQKKLEKVTLGHEGKAGEEKGSLPNGI